MAAPPPIGAANADAWVAAQTPAALAARGAQMLQYSETAQGQRALLTIGELLDSQQRAGGAALGPPTGPLHDLFATPVGTTGLKRGAKLLAVWLVPERLG